MSVVPVGFVCTECGIRRDNPEARHRSNPPAFLNIANAYQTELCAECKSRGCRCHTWPRHRLMADGHRPDCLART